MAARHACGARLDAHAAASIRHSKPSSVPLCRCTLTDNCSPSLLVGRSRLASAHNAAVAGCQAAACSPAAAPAAAALLQPGGGISTTAAAGCPLGGWDLQLPARLPHPASTHRHRHRRAAAPAAPASLRARFPLAFAPYQYLARMLRRCAALRLTARLECPRSCIQPIFPNPVQTLNFPVRIVLAGGRQEHASTLGVLCPLAAHAIAAVCSSCQQRAADT